MQVVDHHRHRPVLGRPVEQLADHLERPVLEGLGRELGQPALRVALHVQPQQRAEVRIDLGRPGSEQALDRAPERDAYPQLGVVGADAQPLAEEVPEEVRVVPEESDRERRSIATDPRLRESCSALAADPGS